VFEEIRAMATDERTSPEGASHFLHEIIERDLAANRHGGRVVTRFPPEPNGFLHIGHAKSICLNFGLAQRYGGVCHLRLDDTNPTTEDIAYVEAIQRDVKWLGFDWADKLFFASDYYEKLYAFAEQLIRAGKAYVCSLSEEEFRVVRGTVNEPGRESPYRNRSVEENLDLFARMRAGEFPDGAHVVRAKIDMASPNMKMRDWPLLRIRHEHHYRRGDSFCVYPLYDFAHCLSDYLENITHSVCTLEFESNRELYDWILEAVGADPLSRPRQYEFARLSLTTTMMSKRKLLELVERKLVSGWDDPRMPTLSGLRRRGVTPEALRDFCERIGIAKTNSVVEIALFDHVLREDLDPRSPRVMGVLRPLEVVLTDLPEGETVELDAPYWPAELGRPESRKVPLSRRIFIEQDDFMEEPPKDFHRLAPGREVRLRHAAVIRCDEVVKDPATGAIVELRCSRVPAADGKRVKGTIHWVSKAHAVDAEVRLYDRLFVTEMPGQSDDVASELNPRSLEVLRGKLEPSLASAKGGDRFQLERLGFFVVDDADSRPGRARPRAHRDAQGHLGEDQRAQRRQGAEGRAARQARRSAQGANKSGSCHLRGRLGAGCVPWPRRRRGPAAGGRAAAARPAGGRDRRGRTRQDRGEMARSRRARARERRGDAALRRRRHRRAGQPRGGRNDHQRRGERARRHARARRGQPSGARGPRGPRAAHRRRRHRGRRGRGAGRERGAGRPLPRGQRQRAGRARGPGHAQDRRQSEPAARRRPVAQEARRSG
jgi:glutaminyl-tRNA synthetase